MDQASEMYAAYGRAMAATQALELTLSNTVEALKLDQGASFDPFAPLTLGQLIQALKRLQPIRSTLLAELAQALETRNWLAHGYFRRRNRAKLGHPEEIARLQRIESGFLRLSDEIGTIIRPYVHTNSKGQRYYLHTHVVTLRGGERQRIFFFAREQAPFTSITRIPTGRAVVENPRTGLPLLKKFQSL